MLDTHQMPLKAHILQFQLILHMNLKEVFHLLLSIFFLHLPYILKLKINVMDDMVLKSLKSYKLYNQKGMDTPYSSHLVLQPA